MDIDQARQEPALARSILRWTPWIPLEGSWRGTSVSDRPGLYRVRRSGQSELIDYIGETGLPLRNRVRMLAGVYKSDMPYRDPHTAGPGLWALRDTFQCLFEVSVYPISGSLQWRNGWESVAIALYRQEQCSSPTLNFGRMPLGYCLTSISPAGACQSELPL